jgi:transcriptional regulator with XRE-family HTH domain
MGSQIKSGLTNPANLALGAITGIVTAIIDIDKGAATMAKSMNMTYSEALGTRKELTEIANSSLDSAVNTRGLQESLLAVNAAVGARVSLNDEDLITMTKMREQAGLSNEESIGILKLSQTNGKSLEENNQAILGGAKAYAGRNKIAINEKEILKEVSKMSASLTLSLGGSAAKMAEAAVKARQFGLNLEQAEKISSSLLNFESSIENELSAELLLGKDLNFERARGLALNGDTAAAAAEIAKQVGSASDFNNMNVIQQEAIAKAAGMERNELAQSLIDKEALTKLGVKGAKSAQEAYNELKAQGMSEAEIAKKLGSDENARMYEQQGIQEKFNQTVEKLKEIFMNVANALMPVFDIFSSIFDIVGPIVGLIGKMDYLILKPFIPIYISNSSNIQFLLSQYKQLY